MSEHTPLPWQIKRGATMGVIVNQDGEQVAAALSDAVKSSDERDANAELIVRAVNNHDALVKALRDLVAACNTYDDTPDSTLNAARYVNAQERAGKLLAALSPTGEAGQK